MALGLKKEPRWIFLNGTYEEILSRMEARKEHYMPSSLLQSQFETLEVPDYALFVSIQNSPEKIVAEISKAINKKGTG